MKASKNPSHRKLMAKLLMAGASLLSLSTPLSAQTASEPATTTAPAAGVIRQINVTGSQRIEGDTVRSYIRLRPGGRYNSELIDDAIRQLLETELFADVQIRDDNGILTIEVRENPVINRIILEGNKRIKEDKIRPEIKAAPRQIFTRSKVRADVARIIELYQRKGRYAATVEPKMVTLDQNRVDIIFEINEGPVSKVRQINIIGNSKFSDKKLRGEMATRQTGITTFLGSRTSYDPDRLAYDQSKMRQFYLTEGYADFRVVSAVAELTPDKKDFIVTYVVEEGERYKFGDIKIVSELRDFKPNEAALATKKGNWFNAKMMDDVSEQLQESAGLFGYAFAEVNPDVERNKETRTMGVTFRIDDAPRVYVERIDINGNTNTQDKVIRREMRLAEGDAFNSILVKRSSDRIKSLGYFQEKFELEQKPGSAPDQIILEANVEEQNNGQLQLSAGFSSLERFILSFSIEQRNWRGKGQILNASVNYSNYSKSAQLGFTEPYFLDRNIALGADIYRQDFNQFNYGLNNKRNTTYQNVRTGGGLRVGIPITEFLNFQGRYALNFENVTLERDIYYFNNQCDVLTAGRYLCDAIGKRTTSSLGYSLFYDNLDNRARPTNGSRYVLGQDFAGLGGNVKYLRSTADVTSYKRVFGNFVLSGHIEGGYMKAFGKANASGDRLRLTDRWTLGEPQIRGFDIRGVGPRVLRQEYDFTTGALITDRRNLTDDAAIGGKAYYLGKIELEIPLGSGAKELGLRPSLFLDVGSVFGVRKPQLTKLSFFTDPSDNKVKLICRNAATGAKEFSVDNATCSSGFTLFASAFNEDFLGDTWKPRLSVGVGVNWNSPFGPFRIDLGKALVKYPGDDTKLFTFNVGTSFQ